MKIKYSFTLTLVLLALFNKGQNLISNGGFEKWEKGAAIGWEDFALTPDYYDENGNKFWYDQRQCGEKMGKGFLGMANSEVTGTRLITPLEKNKEYLITIYAQRPQSFCPAGVSTVHVAFTVNKLPKVSDGKKIESYRAPFITLYPPDKKTVKDRCKWVTFSGVYKAAGNEVWFYLGGSMAAGYTKAVKDTIVTDDSMDKSECLYMNYDSVVVKELSTQPFVLEGIYFETNKSTLLPASIPALDKLYDYAQTCSDYKLKITGHTDNVGDKAKNLALSKQRAQAVATYLEKKGIPKKRLIAEGAGDKNPVADNASEEGKAKNRRVEAKLLK